jgi:hypothetical protein
MTTPTPAPRFEERLLHQLKHVVAQTPAPQPVAPATRRVPLASRIPRRRLALSGAGLATAVAASAAAVLATSGGVASPAYAVQSRANGTVSVSISDLRDAAGLERRLRAAGIPAIVNYVAEPERCAGAAGTGRTMSGPAAGQAGVVRSQRTGDDGPSTAAAGGAGPQRATHTTGSPPPGGAAARMSMRVDRDGRATFTLNADDVKPGQTLMVAATTGTFSSLGMAIVDDTKHAPALPCVPGDAR